MTENTTYCHIYNGELKAGKYPYKAKQYNSFEEKIDDLMTYLSTTDNPICVREITVKDVTHYQEESLYGFAVLNDGKIGALLNNTSYLLQEATMFDDGKCHCSWNSIGRIYSIINVVPKFFQSFDLGISYTIEKLNDGFLEIQGVWYGTNQIQ